MCCSHERVLPKKGSRLQHTKPDQTTLLCFPHKPHHPLVARMHALAGAQEFAMQAAVLSREEAMGGWPKH